MTATRTVTMDARGNFAVSEDPDHVLAIALVIATAPQHLEAWTTIPTPNGERFSIQGIGAMWRAPSRDELPAQFDDDPDLDPEGQELWALYRDPTPEWKWPGWGVITGDELRSLVATAVELRAAWR